MTEKQEKNESIIIIGGGPSGLAAAIYAARANLSPLVIEGVVPGGQLTQTTEVENYPGFPKGILGPELVGLYRAQAERFQTRFITQNVTKIEKTGKILNVSTENNTYATRAVLVATGAEAMWLNIPSEQRLRGKGVSACATCDGFFFKDKTVAVVGGGDTAMEEALFLTKFTKKVYIIHRRDSFRASKIMQQRVLTHEKIEPVWNATVVEVLGQEHVTGVKLDVMGTAKELQLDGLFLGIGHKPSTEFLKGSGVLLDNKGYVYTSMRAAMEQAQGGVVQGYSSYNFNYQYMTAVNGIFASGDCVDHVYRQAGTAVGMGIAAELEIEVYLSSQ